MKFTLRLDETGEEFQVPRCMDMSPTPYGYWCGHAICCGPLGLCFADVPAHIVDKIKPRYERRLMLARALARPDGDLDPPPPPPRALSSEEVALRDGSAYQDNDGNVHYYEEFEES